MGEKVYLDYIARTKDFEAKVKAMGELSSVEKKKMIADYAAIIRAEQETERAAVKAAKTQAAAAKEVALAQAATNQRVSQGKEALASLGAAASVLDPQIGAAVSQVGALSGVLKASSTGATMAGASLGVLAPLVVTIGLAVMAYRKESAIANAETRELGGSVDGLSLALKDMDKLTQAGTASLARFETLTRDASTELDILTGKVTALDAAIARRQRQISESAKEAADLAASRLVQAQKELEANEKRLESAEYAAQAADSDVYLSESGLKAAQDRVAASRLAVESASAEIASLKAATSAARQQVAQVETLTAAKTRHTSSSRASTSAAKEQAAAEREQEAALRASAAATDQLDAIREQAYQSQLAPMDELLRKQELELANVEALGRASGDAVAAAQAYHEVSKRQTIERITLLEREAAKTQAAADLVEQRSKAAVAGVARTAEMALGSLGDIASFAADQLSAAGNSSGARKAFAAWKAFAIAAATAQGYQAAVAAYASTATIPVVGPALAPVSAAAAVIAAAVQIAKIKSTQMGTYHSGGIVMAPDEQYTPGAGKTTRPEAVLTGTGKQAAGGDEGVRALNRGQAMPGQIVVINQYKGRDLDRQLRDLVNGGIGVMGELARATGPRPGQRW